MDRREYIIKYIKSKLKEFQALGKVYSEEKINSLADKLTNSDKSLEEVCILIDNKFEHQLRKITHNNHLESIKEYYLSSIDQLKKGNNCYLLSYTQGIKVLEQAYVKEKSKKATSSKEVTINNKKKGFKRENNVENDYELIRSEIAYLLDIPFMKTYRMFDASMNPQGIVKESSLLPTERVLDLEETLQFVKEESSKFTAKQELIAYHDKQKKRGLKDIPSKKEYKVNIEYVLNLFKLLPDINMAGYNKLKKEYLSRIIFSLLTDSKDIDCTSIGIIVNKEKPKYTYTVTPLFKKENNEEIMLPDTKTICNFYIVDKKELFHTIIVNYYEDIKELVTLILNNQETLILIIDQVIKEHLEYDDYINYKRQVESNLRLICEEVKCKKAVSPDTEEDCATYKINNDNYLVKIEPFFESETKEEEEKGSAAIVAVIGIVLVVTILLIIAAIYAVSKVEM